MSLSYLERNDRPDLAYHYTPPETKGQGLPTVVFLGGYRSDMEGTKATFLEAQCKKRGQGYLRFDYSAHGQSGGEFKDETLATWLDDARTIINEITDGPLILVGSSMGGWLALAMGNQEPERIAGIIGIAAAPDFTRSLIQDFDQPLKDQLASQGYVLVPNDYSDEPYIFTQELIDSGEALCLLDRENEYPMPVRLLQGMKDNDVPWQTAYRIKNTIVDGDVDVIPVEQATHRMSRPEDLALINMQVRLFSGLEE